MLRQYHPDGSQTMKVRIYSNEQAYDIYRKAPTRLLYESDSLPVVNGYSTRTISGLSVELPRDSVTFTVEFQGLKANEEAGLLLYSPPTIGFSFNEFWRRSVAGAWQPILYSTTDLSKKANAVLRLTAIPAPAVDQEQADASSLLPLRDPRRRRRIAQTFTPAISGRLDTVSVWMTAMNGPVTVRILDAPNGVPGTDVLGSFVLPAGTNGEQVVDFYNEGIYLNAGEPCAIEFSTDAGVTDERAYFLECTHESYADGQLWVRDEDGGNWTAAALPNDKGLLNARYRTKMVPGGPFVRLSAPLASERFVAGQDITLKSFVSLPPGKTLARVKYYVDDQQVGDQAAPPYDCSWPAPAMGLHVVKAFAQDVSQEVYRSDPVMIAIYATNPPANDDFVTRQVLTGAYARGSAATENAISESGEPILATNAALATVWWSWTATNSEPVTMSVQNSGGPAVLSVFTGVDITALAQVTNGAPSCIFIPTKGTSYSIAAAPLSRGTEVVLDIASSDWMITSPATNTLGTAPATLQIAAAGGPLRQITNVQFYANGTLAKEFAASPFQFAQDFNSAGSYDITVAATDARGIRTISSPRKIMVRPASGVFDAHTELFRIIDGSYSLVFDTPVNIPVSINYSDDLTTWHTANDTITGTGGQLVWGDHGPPKTDKDPRTTPRRFYRLQFGFQ
jgi:hypothetical protein